MTPVQLCAVTLLRACVVGLFTWIVAAPILRRFSVMAPFAKTASLLALIHFIAIPPLVPAYCYSTTALAWVRNAWFAECIYLALLVGKSIPLFVIARYVAPPSVVSDAAWHVLRTVRGDYRLWWRMIRSGLSSDAIPLVLVTWNVFQEFEMASFLMRPTWTVWMFDAYVGGAATQDVLKKSWSVFLVNCLILGAIGRVCTRLHTRQSIGEMPRMGTSHVSWILCQIVICLILLVATAIPCLKTLAESLSGYRILMTSGHLLQEVGTGIVVAFLAALLAYTGALTLLEANSRYRPWIAWLSCLPGMFGSLTLSLVLISVLYGGYANTYYGSYVPWIVALALTMVPKSLFLAILVDVAVVRTSTHVAKMCGVMSNGKYSRKSTQFAWALYGRRHVAALMLVAYLAYLDLPAAAILGPPNAVPAPVRLYNLMHYGHSQLLSAMIVVAFVMPALLAIAVIVALNLALRIGHRR